MPNQRAGNLVAWTIYLDKEARTNFLKAAYAAGLSGNEACVKFIESTNAAHEGRKAPPAEIRVPFRGDGSLVPSAYRLGVEGQAANAARAKKTRQQPGKPRAAAKRTTKR